MSVSIQDYPFFIAKLKSNSLMQHKLHGVIGLGQNFGSCDGLLPNGASTLSEPVLRKKQIKV